MPKSLPRLNRRMKASVEATLRRALLTLKAKVDPRHTAVIVVDMQNDFLADGGMMHREGADMSAPRAMVPRLAAFIEAARKAGCTMVFIQSLYTTDDSRWLSDVWLEQMLRSRKSSSYIKYPVCEVNGWNADFYGVRPLPGEVIVNKHRFSAFINTDLDTILRSRGIRTLIMTGVATNACVESTSRDGFMKDYYIVMPEDCVATWWEDLHRAALKNISALFGEVTTSAQIVKIWRALAK